MKLFATISRCALLSGSCWYAYGTYHEYHHRKICEVEAARIKQELDSTVSKTSEEVEITLVNSQSTLSSWLCYLPSQKAASVVLRTDGVFGRVLLRLGPSNLHQTAMIQLQFYEARDEVEEDRLTIWGPDFREVGITLGEGFRILKYAHLLDRSEGGFWGGASGMPGNNIDGTPWIFRSTHTGQGYNSWVSNRFNGAQNFSSRAYIVEKRLELFRYTLEKSSTHTTTEKDVAIVLIVDEP